LLFSRPSSFLLTSFPSLGFSIGSRSMGSCSASLFLGSAERGR
jgi:hypothetical protein